MRTFVKYDRQGTIVGTTRVESLPEGMAQPFLFLRQGESVVELAPDAGTSSLALADLHRGYRVDPATGDLVVRGPEASGPAAPSRRRVAPKGAAATGRTKRGAKRATRSGETSAGSGAGRGRRAKRTGPG